MSEKSLLNWLSETDDSWRWQTVLDTLAFGEGIPLRLINLACLQDFHNCLRSLCKDKNVQALIDVKPLGYESLCDAFDKTFGSRKKTFEKRIETWVWLAEKLRQGIRDESLPDIRKRPIFSKKTLQLFDEAFPFFGKRFFKTFTANAIPLDFLSKLAVPFWRWYKLLWLYHEFMIEGALEQGEKDGGWRICVPAFEVPGLYFIWRRLKKDSEADPDLLLIAGPVFGPCVTHGVSWRDAMQDAATFLMEFQRRVEGTDGISVHKERFLRAAHAEAVIPQVNLERSANRVLGALALFGASGLPKPSVGPRAHELRLMTLLALFLQRQKGYLFFACQRYMIETDHFAIALRWGTGLPEETLKTTLLVRITADVVALGIEGGNGGANILSDDGRAGSRLFLMGSSLGEAASRELMEELDSSLSQLLTHFHRHITLFNSERVSIINDRLQDHWDRLISDAPNVFYSHTSLAHRICARVAELVRADSTKLYDYDTVREQDGVLNAIGMYFSNPFHLEYAKNLKSEMQTISGTPDRPRSVCYRAIDNIEQKIIFDYDEKTGESVPRGESIYVPQGQGMPVFPGTIATPIMFNGRIIALLEANALEPWTFRQNQLFSLQQVAGVLAPFLYHHRYVRTLQGIQEAILRFHDKKIKQDELYNAICKRLTGLFACHGAAMWVRDTEDTNRFIRKGIYNVERVHDSFDFVKNNAFTGWCIEEFGKAEDTQLFNMDCEDRNWPVINREELLRAGIKTLTVILIPNDQQQVTAAITLYSKGSHQPYDAAWDGIARFIGGYIALVVEAVNAFVSAERRYEAAHVHELYHDAALIAEKGKKLAHSMQGLRDGVRAFWNVMDNPRFREELRSPLLSMIGDSALNALKDLPRQFDSSLFLVDKDLEYYSSTLLTRIQTLFGKERHNLSPKANVFLQATGDIQLARSIDWNEKKEWVSLKDIYLAIKEGSRGVFKKGLYVDFDEGEIRGLEIGAQKTIITTVVRNLFINAVKYSLRNEAITISQRLAGGNQIAFSIWNKGPSFDRSSEALYVLGPNHRGSHAKRVELEDEGGFGMGLYIVDQLCRHLLGVDFRFREQPEDNGISMFRAELLFPEDKVRYRHAHGFSK
uniref:Histidine kinase-, DNA gyrase B-, and HSP90-like ATPase n=1 Tax=Candidatus Kentrum sp. DK TaxID=2126562 RepID=A0A450SH45_9GAMM|nr:MAG: Histidine kinase-, DNA gyrase B-, and HSP90-like ATPase [Candidatus Kentron sp. DK]